MGLTGQTLGVVPHRDIGDFEERAPGYDEGWRGRVHHEISDRTARLALSLAPRPSRVLDVGSGTGYLLRRLAETSPDSVMLSGIDPAPSMVATARIATRDPRIDFQEGVAERLPFPDRTFDLVVSTTSFDHWADQKRGLQEIARVMRAAGQLVLVDQFSDWLLPTLLFGRRGKARTKGRATRLLEAAAFTDILWHDVYASFIRAATARCRDSS